MAKKKKHGSYGYDEFEYDINDTETKKSRSSERQSYEDTRRENYSDKNEESDAPQEDERNEEKRKKTRNPSSLGVQITTAVLFVAAIFVVLCFIFSKSANEQVVGKFGNVIGGALLGVFGGAAILIPLFIIISALHLKRDVASGRVALRIFFSVLSVILVALIIHAFFYFFASDGEGVVSKELFVKGEFANGIKKLYASGMEFVGGGVVGGLLAVSLIAVIGNAGTMIFSVLFLLICLMFAVGTTPAALWKRVKFYIIRKSEQRAARKSEPKPKKEKKHKEKKEHDASSARRDTENTQNSTYGEHIYTGRNVVVSGTKRGPGENYASDTMSDTVRNTSTSDRERKMKNIESFSFTDTTEVAVYDEKLDPVNSPLRRKINLSETFDEPENDSLRQTIDETPTDPDNIETEASVDVTASDTLNVRRTQTTAHTAPAAAYTPAYTPAPKKEPPKPKYLFPPVDLLGYRPPIDDGNIEHELATNARKLVETLESFNIHTKVVNISRGPAVTRYEIAPEIGTKVSAIVNRVDDISLGLASNVLIEGVIPGKSAIGIEVPNKNVSTVYLRELIDDDQFREAKSKLTTSLGIDLTGSKIYLDVSKMPHLLIAGATGTGKSVCMNSLIVSLLYKSTPDEVKFILVDPKKVEFNIYEGLPHLLVPVVSDPKKAAGALNWCVNEMERRYDILEASGKRNLTQYNEATANDPSAEKLPQVVIIIDELADLMLAARDVVETSIARIAAKARAAGMHLIIGTQRPSVDVITGTIKSNIPSRIACTVKSQIDSRTILDQAGAEKLVGRGDMLYAPVGARLPLRVQGAYVDEKEIEDIVSFIKEHVGEVVYDRDIADQIEREAEACGRKGKGAPMEGGASDDEFEDDPMLDEAIKLAIDEKKISTSLIQRKLQLGYGRAAKLIDIMEARGIVSAPNGQKPRDVLITYDDYLEMSMRSDG